jgi:hypothetical protein
MKFKITIEITADNLQDVYDSLRIHLGELRDTNQLDDFEVIDIDGGD